MRNLLKGGIAGLLSALTAVSAFAEPTYVFSRGTSETVIVAALPAAGARDTNAASNARDYQLRWSS